MGRGAKTRDAILSRAVALASQSGLSGLTIGGLAKDLGLSKSGLIAHFGTKEALDLAVLQAAAKLFGDTVIVPAFDAEPGEPRLRVLHHQLRGPDPVDRRRDDPRCIVKPTLVPGPRERA